MIKLNRIALCSLVALTVSACVDPYTPTPRPDYVIKVIPTAHGDVALPPPCPSWANENADPYDNEPIPQFGCSYARNLASMVERPDDLIEGRSLANARGVTEVGAVRRYDNNQTRGLITPSAEVSQIATTTASTGASSLSGDITGSAAAAAPAAAAASSP